MCFTTCSLTPCLFEGDVLLEVTEHLRGKKEGLKIMGLAQELGGSVSCSSCVTGPGTHRGEASQGAGTFISGVECVAPAKDLAAIIH